MQVWAVPQRNMVQLSFEPFKTCKQSSNMNRSQIPINENHVKLSLCGKKTLLRYQISQSVVSDKQYAFIEGIYS